MRLGPGAGCSCVTAAAGLAASAQAGGWLAGRLSSEDPETKAPPRIFRDHEPPTWLHRRIGLIGGRKPSPPPTVRGCVRQRASGWPRSAGRSTSWLPTPGRRRARGRTQASRTGLPGSGRWSPNSILNSPGGCPGTTLAPAGLAPPAPAVPAPIPAPAAARPGNDNAAASPGTVAGRSATADRSAGPREG
jgi:hypothetical protein